MALALRYEQVVVASNADGSPPAALPPVFTLPFLVGIVVQPQLVASLPRLPLPVPAVSAQRVLVNDNRSAAGTRTGNVLTLALDVIESAWRPEGDTDPEVPILAFAERGQTPRVPGPMLRVRQGTEVHLTLRNRSDTALMIAGLRPRLSAAIDTIHLAAGATRELRYRLDSAGTFFYWGSFLGTTMADRLWKDSQLNGAVIVDPPEGSPPDRVLVISEWFHPYDNEKRPFEVVSVINGKAFPHTERLTMQQGDSTRFRVLNTIPLWHPMHLHGFYYRVHSRGTWSTDTPIEPAMQPLINTDLLRPGGTMTLSFEATTPGNWLFHCHFSFHMDETVTLAGAPTDSASAANHPVFGHGSGPAGRSSTHSMHGLVMGLHVTPRAGYAEPAMANARNIKLLVQKKENALLTGAPAYGFVMQNGSAEPARDSVIVPGPVLELERGKPVRIVVHNRLEEPTGVHWHGLEIESFPDGVANWSGMGNRIMPPIAPNDSFVAAFTPPRSGTFPYHSHLNERHQINSGMYGAIIVTDQPRDLTRDHLIVVGGGGPELMRKIESPFALVNGRRFPPPLRLTAGVPHRLRIVSIHPDWRLALSLRTDSTVAQWRAVAKDGADLPPTQATTRPAHIEMGPGETADFEFLPLAPGTWRLEVRTVEPGWYIPLDVIVSAPKPAGASP